MSLQPPTVAPGDRHIEASIARLAAVPVTFANVWDPATCPADLLPWLAWGLSIDVWDPDWSEEFKRLMIAEAIPRQRRKGTVAAVREVLDAFGVGLTIHEWFDQFVPLAPYTFEVRLPVEGGETATAALIEKVADQVVRVKPARAHFTVAQTMTTAGGVGALAAARLAAALRLGLSEADYIDWSDIIQTEDGEPIVTEAGSGLEEEFA